MVKANLKGLDTHFKFGENWIDYLRNVDEVAVAEAERGLTKLVPPENLCGARFLDVGCGSGLHSLAAIRLGASQVLAVDIDPASVHATKTLIRSYAPGANFDARVLSIFDADTAQLGTFDVVYSWGVLHHTGAMWEAVEKAARLVGPGGLFAIALYQKRATCALWSAEKRLYVRLPEIGRKAIRALYKGAFYAGLLATGRRPAAFVREYKGKRGMNFHTDVHDWLGGYPYESATPDEVVQRFQALGFEQRESFPLGKKIGVFGTGCAEYVFVRTTGAR